jgi:hypothetical protein
MAKYICPKCKSKYELTEDQERYLQDHSMPAPICDACNIATEAAFVAPQANHVTLDTDFPAKPNGYQLAAERDANREISSIVGWICPVCGRGNAPLLGTCPCHREKGRKAQATQISMSTLAAEHGLDYHAEVSRIREEHDDHLSAPSDQNYRP